MEKEHHYKASITWTGNRGTGTSGYRKYSRNHVISIENKPDIQASSDPSFQGDPSCYDPEELFLISISSCHMLWYLHLCAEVGIIVLEYNDNASGIMIETKDGGGKFKEVTLNPFIVVTEVLMIEEAISINAKAHALCFIANSINFPVIHKPMVHVK